MAKAVAGDAGTYGKGGLGPTDKNPNSHGELNDMPNGPGAHMMGWTDDGGYQGGGSETVSGKNGGKFHFK